MISNRIIFISPLDWGLGHASRCVPIIHELKKSNKIILGVTHLNVTFFETYFPELEKIHLPSYAISYSKRVPLWLKLMLQWPKIKKTIQSENEQLKEICVKHKIDLVISDNRFGLYHKNLHCIFISHQLNLQGPFWLGMANLINKKFIHRFNEVWVPDYEEINKCLSGKLSHSKNIQIPVKYIGPKSALSVIYEQPIKKEIDLLLLLSGPEPQRSILENLLLHKFETSSAKIVLVRGTDCDLKPNPNGIRILNYAYHNELRDLIVNSETVICRSGYSTLMDLFLLNKKKMFLIPTPGQLEQEYLAIYWRKHFGAKTLLQKNIKDFHFDLEGKED